MKTKEDYYQVFLEQLKNNKKTSGYSEYGSAVMPLLKKYKEIDNSKEKDQYYQALKMMLNDESEEIRSYGITLCLGFFVFRDQI